MDAKELTELLNKYPDTKKHVEEMLLFVDESKEEVNLADEAEERVIEGVRGTLLLKRKLLYAHVIAI